MNHWFQHTVMWGVQLKVFRQKIKQGKQFSISLNNSTMNSLFVNEEFNNILIQLKVLQRVIFPSTYSCFQTETKRILGVQVIITFIHQNHTERELILETIDLPKFLLQPSQEDIDLWGSITWVRDWQKLFEEIGNRPRHEVGAGMEGLHLLHEFFLCLWLFHGNRESHCVSLYVAYG